MEPARKQVFSSTAKITGVATPDFRISIRSPLDFIDLVFPDFN